MNNKIRELRENYHFLALFLFSVLNMLFMHYQFFFTIGIDFYFSKTSVLDNFFAVLLDVTVIFLFFIILFLGKVKLSLTFTFFVTLILSFSNIVYSRFFGQYLSFSAIGQVGNLSDNIVIKSVLSEIRIIDSFYIVSFAFFFLILKICKKRFS